MDREARAIDDEALSALCPIEAMRDLFDTVVETSRLFAAGLSESSSFPSSLGRSLSSAIEANGVLFEQLSGVARRFEPGRAARPAESAGHSDAPSASGPSEGTHPVVLAGKPGDHASGAFLLHNVRPETTTATVLPTAFVDAAGERVDVELRLDPSRVVLEPGQEVVVTATAVIPPDSPPGQWLRGAIHVPGLTASVVPVVIRSE